MRKFLLTFLLAALCLLPISASAQAAATLSFATVQFWPEYDDPRMLVLTDFQIADGIPLPASLTFRIPLDATLIAVASQDENGQFLDHAYAGPNPGGEYQTFSLVVEKNIPYRFEYYQPLSRNGAEREFSYLWNNGYGVENFQYLFLEPLNVTQLSLDPQYATKENSDGLNYYESAPAPLAGGAEFALNVRYSKTTNDLVAQSPSVQIADPIDENTPGRVSLAKVLPYVIGGVGVLMILGGAAYYVRWGKSAQKKRRQRKHAEEENDVTSAYCPQCGARAKLSDKFCRTCGARLRNEKS
ncbi:MAG: zinc ribbon domain-containing protein [Anaerolineales bacterium]|nr:zinc ribbon domain-containing protein [Anaerolineales bacterium]